MANLWEIRRTSGPLSEKLSVGISKPEALSLKTFGETERLKLLRSFHES